MTTRMLIDARHREETRVAVVKGNRIEEFDFESAERKQLKGNIYLAKVTRVEPSLQAAFVDYGGNRHGFLAFSEIHPDYYQIPKEDRDALLREEAEHAAEEAALRAEQEARDEERGAEDGDGEDIDEESVERFDDDGGMEPEVAEELEGGDQADAKSNGTDEQVEALRQRRMNLRRRYKIQDVIRRRQVLLVQVTKEERGNKGAALTTYLSLAGRYCVLMPNTSHGGGISRKISNASDRKRLKLIMAELKLPPSMGCIVRTAGLSRTKTEIKRDFDYLARLWDGIRETTLASAAPALIYGDSDLMKRAIRDIYNKDIDEVIVEGDEGYRQAKDFMKLLMPSHARRVKHYSDPVPLFQRAHVEDQLAAMYHPVVQLKSGGYLVINPTEALVSIDINSGRSTREHNIEQTATATNLEAAQEIARQLRLRDMAGLIVIDFIDMDHSSNVRKVEKAMKEALKNDRARIQVGRISQFGLMEMSRQRLRTGVLEASTRACPHCEGTGLVRTASSAGLSALRLIEDEAARGRGSLLTLRASQEAAFYVLNRKRADIAEIEDRYGVRVEILPDGEQEGARMSVETSGPPPAYAPRFEAPVAEEDEGELTEAEAEDEEEADEPSEGQAGEQSAGAPERLEEQEGGSRRRRRRRGRRGKPRVEGVEQRQPESEAADEATTGIDAPAEEPAGDEGVEEQLEEAAGQPPAERSRRRRSRRGRGGGAREDILAEAADADALTIDEAPAEEPEAGPEFVGEPPLSEAATESTGEAPAQVEGGAAPARSRRRPRARTTESAPAPAEAAAAPAESKPPAESPAESAPKPKRTRRKPADAAGGGAALAQPTAADAAPDEPSSEAAGEAAPGTSAETPGPKRRTSRKPPAEHIEEPPPVAETDDAAAPTRAEQPSSPPPVAGNDTGAVEPRRGWWQRTFGA